MAFVFFLRAFEQRVAVPQPSMNIFVFKECLDMAFSAMVWLIKAAFSQRLDSVSIYLNQPH